MDEQSHFHAGVDNPESCGMANQSASPVHDDLLEGWHKQAWLPRMFLPKDFLDSVSAGHGESLVCHKTTNEYLLMKDKVQKKTIKMRETRKYTTDVDYRPQQFKKQTLKIITDAAVIECRRCDGSGEVYCPPTMTCGSCGGSGWKETNCGGCGGSGSHSSQVPEYSESRYGTVQTGTTTVTFSCSSCGGSGRSGSICSGCGGGGIVTCSKCGGDGTVTCDDCEGAGQLVRGNFITREFSPKTELEYQLSALEKNEFKNGLKGKHFKTMPGDLIYREFQTPGDKRTVLERKSIESYDVLSHCYSYKDKEFHLNHIASGASSKYVSSSLPLSAIRVAMGSALVTTVAAGVIAALTFLA